LRDTPSFDPTRVISIAAGVTTATLRSFFAESAIIRVMPNTPLMVGAGMSTVCVAADTPRAEGELVRELFSLMGDAVLLDEGLINAATALSGSGPAYFALFVEELARAGERVGLAPEDAALLATQTLRGTARYLELTEATPAELRVAVTSPGGTTQAALELFEAEGLSLLVERAVEAALTRAEELA
jgi:pyrroline-5-carboxylate reductase